MLQRAASSAYSWWWASHIRTKQSKWLEQNLQDMEDKVGSMLSIIDEDGDSFAKRAEMYYQKRPELVHLVEDSFRAYRALAERYDHISKDLQSANRTIARVYPEKIHYSAMDEDDERDSSKKKLLPPKNSSENPSPNKPPVPKVPAPPKSFKPLPTFKTKKSQLQQQLKRNTSSSARAVPCSGLSKEQAVEEIDKLQKGILALQTEKEFVNSSYENAVAKYWQIENRINEMQGSVCGLQDEFGIGSVIEDNEARKLMASTALKSCQETLNRLKETQEKSIREASLEQQKIKEARHKLQTFKDECSGEQPGKQELMQENNKSTNENLMSTTEEDVDHDHLQSLPEHEIKVLGDVDAHKSLTVTELVDRIDETVDKVVRMETTVASHTTMVQRLRSEAEKLQQQMETLEMEDTLVEGLSSRKSHNIRVLEEELLRVENLEQTAEHQNKSLGAHFREAKCSLDELSHKVENLTLDEMGQIAGWNVLEIEEHDHMLLAGDHLKASKQKKGEKFLSVVSQLLSSVFDTHEASTDKSDERKQQQGQKGSDLELDLGIERYGDVMAAAITQDSPQMTGKEQKEVDELPGVSDRNEVSGSLDDETFEKIQDVRPGKEGENMAMEKHEQLMSAFNWLRIQEGDQLSQVADSSDSPLGVIHNEHLSGDEEQQKELILASAIQDDADKEDQTSKQEMMQQDHQSATEHTISSEMPQGDHIKGKLILESVAAAESDSETKWCELEEEDSEPDWRRFFLSGLEDRERFLLEEYTSVLKTLKDAKRKLSEAEKKNKEGLNDQAAQLRKMLHASSLKDKEIQSLRRTLSLMKMNTGEKHDMPLPETSHSEQMTDHTAQGSDFSSSELEKRAVDDANDTTVEETHIQRSEIILNDEPQIVSGIEDKFRSDLDELLEENLEFWLRFCTSVHQIQKFQSSIEDLQAEVARLVEANKKQETSTKTHESLKSDAKPIYKHLKEIQTELKLWLEHNSLLKDELETRHSSLSDIQEDISRLSNATEDSELSEYQAAKFQGEVNNMKQENNKVADELQSCLDRVRRLQMLIDKALLSLNEELGISDESKPKHLRSRIPLRTFLFGVKLRKQKQSFFKCMSPALQKQYSDLASQFPPPR